MKFYENSLVLSLDLTGCKIYKALEQRVINIYLQLSGF